MSTATSFDSWDQLPEGAVFSGPGAPPKYAKFFDEWFDGKVHLIDVNDHKDKNGKIPKRESVITSLRDSANKQHLNLKSKKDVREDHQSVIWIQTSTMTKTQADAQDKKVAAAKS